MIGLVRAFCAGALVAVLAGCSSSAQPQPTPGSTLPPRPMYVAADRVTPCEMLAADQVDRLDLRRPTAVQANVEGVDSPACKWLGPAIDINVQYIPVGAEVALNLPGATIATVNEFGAVRDMPEVPGSPPICQLAIDVAPGQTVRVQANAIPNPPYGMGELCRRADEAASMVMTTLVATAPK